MSTQAAETEVIDGYLVDADGEIVGLAVPEDTIDTPEAADRLLARIGRHEAQIRALLDQERAVVANFARMRKDHEQRVEWLRRRFSPQLEALAREQMEGRKSRTLVLPHGRISLRKTKGETKITNMPACLAWMQAKAPDRLRIQYRVNAADALAAWDESDHSGDMELPTWMQVSGPREVVRIKTGLEA